MLWHREPDLQTPAWLFVPPNRRRKPPSSSPTFTVPGRSRLSPTPPLTSGVLIRLLSCVQTLEDVLDTLTPPPYSFDASIVLQSVRVRHNPKLDQETIELAIESAGFDIASLTSQDSNGNQAGKHLSKHLELFYRQAEQAHRPMFALPVWRGPCHHSPTNLREDFGSSEVPR